MKWAAAELGDCSGSKRVVGSALSGVNGPASMSVPHTTTRPPERIPDGKSAPHDLAPCGGSAGECGFDRIAAGPGLRPSLAVLPVGHDHRHRHADGTGAGRR